MHEEAVRIQSGDIELAGTLCLPGKAGRFPAVLMVHGSGALDRNENTRGQSLNTFNAIAHALADAGVASLRYDKRGCGSSSGSFIHAGHRDLVQDATECLHALAGFSNVSADELYILGHSEGCIIAPQVVRQRPFVAGLILLCPFLEDMASILKRQAAQLERELASLRGIAGLFYKLLFAVTGSPSASQRRLIQKVLQTQDPVVRSGLARFPAKWLRELLALDAKAVFSGTTTPMILVGAEKDL
ncbi:alpha/beta hydrolase [Gilvimarinus sp. 1_MG-2023]|uniref:alpha/beta hydrolase n=1 Tax=Gilvimarinus sp. 1_MG-2023 TaxID=3062638 RepID=UPI0026E4195B|nr:alpha/beta fold hydrolase [Gilvimarinus sp. 1_MG-2023]MDO6747360.1 alpha/beta fold hydrolase [Gilvimarinus sp. 1_MG-2023]